MSSGKRRIVISTALFAPSAELLAILEDVQRQRGSDDITEKYEAFLLDPGLGPPTYLTREGRVVWDDDSWDVAGTRAEAFAAIAAGVRKTGIRKLLELLPERDAAAVDCDDCRGSGRHDADGKLEDVQGDTFSIVCPKCAGLGWTSPAIRLAESVIAPG